MTQESQEIKWEENIFSVPEIYKQDYRNMNYEDVQKMFKNNEERKNKNDEIPWFDDDNTEKMEKENNSKTLKESVSNFKKNTMKQEDDKLYSFNIDKIMELEKYLKSKIFGQDNVIDQIIDNMLMYTYRTKNNEINAWIYLQFGISWSWKNYIWELIAEKLWFELEIIDISSLHFVEAWSLLWVTSWYGNWDESILQNIYERSSNNNGKVILIFDEFDKWQVTENWSCAKFLSSIMSILWNKKVRTKDTNTEIILSNFIFVFNSNYWFDNFKIDEKVAKIWFDIDEKNKQPYQNDNENHLTKKDIEKYFKKDLKVQVSVYNRLKKTNNIIIFNQINNQILENYKNEKYEELKEEISHYLWVKKHKIPKINYFHNKFQNFEINWWFRLLNYIIFEEIKLFLIKKFGLKKNIKGLKINV